MMSLRFTFVLFCSMCLVAHRAETQGLQGSTHLDVDLTTGLVTVTCETAVTSGGSLYYQASVSCFVVDGYGNAVASAYANDQDHLGYATAVQSFQGVPGTAYRATSSHNAYLIYQSEEPAPLPPHLMGLYYLDQNNLGFFAQNPVYGVYDGQTIADPYSSYIWNGPGPRKPVKSPKVHTGSTRDAIVYPIDVVLLIQNATYDFPAQCDSAFINTIGSSYSKVLFFTSLLNTTFYQYPAGTPNIPGNTINHPVASTGTGPGRPISLFPDFYGPASNPTSQQYREFVVTHEGIHHYTGWDDATVFANFYQVGLRHYATYGTEEITTWMMAGCPK